MKMITRCSKLHRPFGNIKRVPLKDGTFWLKGTVTTSDGIVEMYSEPPDTRKSYRSHGFTRLHLSMGGQAFERTFDRFYTERFLVTLAVRFAAEVVEHVTEDTPL